MRHNLKFECKIRAGVTSCGRLLLLLCIWVLNFERSALLMTFLYYFLLKYRINIGADIWNFIFNVSLKIFQFTGWMNICNTFLSWKCGFFENLYCYGNFYKKIFLNLCCVKMVLICVFHFIKFPISKIIILFPPLFPKNPTNVNKLSRRLQKKTKHLLLFRAIFKPFLLNLISHLQLFKFPQLLSSRKCSLLFSLCFDDFTDLIMLIVWRLSCICCL